MIKQYLIALLSLVSSTISFANSTWIVQGHTALSTLTYNGSNAVLNIDWDPSSGCRPTIGLIIMKDKILGPFKSSKRSSDNMVIKIKDTEWSTETILAGYKNGVESLMYAPAPLMQELMRPRTDSINVRPLKDMPFGTFSLEGASIAITNARKNCN